MNRNERKLRAVNTKLVEKSEELLELSRKAEAENRELTDDEQAQRKALRGEITELKEKQEKIRGQLEVEAEIEHLSAALGRSPDARASHGGDGGGGIYSEAPRGGGWAALAGGIDIRAGRRESRVPLGDLISGPRPMASLDPSPGPAFDPLGFRTVRAPVSPFAEDRRYLYPHLLIQALAEGDLNVSEWRQTGTENVTGDPERDPAATTAKAELDISIEHNPEAVKQLAVTVSGVPNAILLSEATLLTFLRLRMAALLNRELDAHVLAQIAAADPPTDLTGSDLIAQVRNAKATAASSGANPTVLALSPEDAVALDLDVQTGAGYTFPLGVTGGSSPLFGMNVVESAQVDDALLIDPVLLGVLYLGIAKLDVDSSGDEFKSNLSTVRLEFTALYHVRQVTGAVEVAAS